MMINELNYDNRISNIIPRDFRQYLLKIETLEYLKIKKLIKNEQAEKLREAIENQYK